MKNYFLIVATLMAIVLSSCNESPYINAPGDNSQNNPEIPTWIPDTNGVVATVAEALEYAAPLKDDEVTSTQYKVTGTFSSPQLQGKQLNFYLSDGKNQIKCQYTANINRTPFSNESQIPATGSIVTVQGPLSKYQGTPQIKEGFIVRITEPAQ